MTLGALLYTEYTIEHYYRTEDKLMGLLFKEKFETLQFKAEQDCVIPSFFVTLLTLEVILLLWEIKCSENLLINFSRIPWTTASVF